MRSDPLRKPSSLSRRWRARREGRYAALTQLASSRNPAHVSWVRDHAWELRNREKFSACPPSLAKLGMTPVWLKRSHCRQRGSRRSSSNKKPDDPVREGRQVFRGSGGLLGNRAHNRPDSQVNPSFWANTSPLTVRS